MLLIPIYTAAVMKRATLICSTRLSLVPGVPENLRPCGQSSCLIRTSKHTNFPAETTSSHVICNSASGLSHKASERRTSKQTRGSFLIPPESGSHDAPLLWLYRRQVENGNGRSKKKAERRSCGWSALIGVEPGRKRAVFLVVGWVTCRRIGNVRGRGRPNTGLLSRRRRLVGWVLPTAFQLIRVDTG